MYLPAQGVPLNLTPEKDLTHNAPTPGKFAARRRLERRLRAERRAAEERRAFGRLLAWDPVKQKEAWRVEHVAPWNGGTLTTAGQSGIPGHGRRALRRLQRHLRREALGDARPEPAWWRRASTYMLDGEQYVSIAVGWGGVFGISQRATELQSPGTVYTFAIGGKAPLPTFVQVPDRRAVEGREIRSQGCRRRHCDLCRGLRATAMACPASTRAATSRTSATSRPRPSPTSKDFVFKGPFRDQGMPDFTGKLTEEDMPKLQAFIQGTADAIRPKEVLIPSCRGSAASFPNAQAIGYAGRQDGI